VQYKSNQPRNKAVTLRRLKISLLESRGQKCERCNYNKSEILQVHHKNRDRRNNNLENLELICPNCHYEEHYL
jgi:RNA-directed DNA polymerase